MLRQLFAAADGDGSVKLFELVFSLMCRCRRFVLINQQRHIRFRNSIKHFPFGCSA